MAKKENKLETLLEQPEIIVEEIQQGKLEEFYNKNHKYILSIGGSLAALIFAIVLFKYWVSGQNEEAQNVMFQAVYYFESDSLKKALDGDGSYPGFVEIVDSYPFTDAANMASFYAGAAYLKLGQFESAVEYLTKFSANDLLVQARAYALTGDAYMEMNDYESAIKYYKKASKYKPTKEFTPDYLMKLGLACELNKDFDGAVEAYSTLIEKYPNSARINDARKYKELSAASLSAN